MPAERPSHLHRLASSALEELGEVFDRLDASIAEALVAELAQARRVVVHGVGREGLMMRALAMRLFHAGLDVSVAGDMTTPPVGPGDLVLLSSGPGGLATVDGLMRIAQRASARVVVVTAQPQSEIARRADAVVLLPARTMADDRQPGASSLPMGSIFEIGQLVFFDCVVQLLAERLGRTAEDLRARHTNLE